MTASSNALVPQSRRTGPGVISLFAGIVIAPLAWALQLLIGYALAAHACFPTDIALSAPLWPHLREIVAGISLLLWLLLGVGFFIAWRNWQATRAHTGAELGGQARGARSRFMALCGLLVSALFAIVQLFTSMGILWIPACGA